MRDNEASHEFASLSPDHVIDAVEKLGFLSDGRMLALNSFENRVYQVGLEEGDPLIVKFYRPGRWSDAQILEEHHFVYELLEQDISVVPPMKIEGETLFHDGAMRIAVFERKGGRAPELDNLDNLYTLGQSLGRIHRVGQAAEFSTRPRLDIESFGESSAAYLLEHFVPAELRSAYESIAVALLDRIRQQFNQLDGLQWIRTHGDCHIGNILWRDDEPNYVDFDDARMAPAIQDLWMLLSGDRQQQTQQLAEIVEGYEMFNELNYAEFSLIESLRTLRMMHYAAWLARRWSDPAFPMHFPWFNTERYWGEHVLELKEQMSALDEPVLKLQ